MRDIQEFGVEKQKIPTPVVPISEGGLGLGNSAIQFFSGYRLPAPQQSKPVSKLEALKRMRFSVVGRAERIARSLEALNQVESLKLTPEEWHFFAEDVGVLAIGREREGDLAALRSRADWKKVDALRAKIDAADDEQTVVDLIREHSHTCYLGERGARHDWGYGCGECPACRLRARGWRDYAADRLTP